MTAPGFVFDPYSHTWRPAPPSARTRADAEACELSRDRVDPRIRDEVERTVRLASRSLGLDPAPKVREHQTPIGKQLEIRQDARGLWGRWSVLPTQAGKDAYLLAKAGVLDSLSIGFIARASRPLGNGTRLLTRIDLFEVSAVALPANVNAVVTDIRTRASGAGRSHDVLADLRHKRVQFSRWRGPR